MLFVITMMKYYPLLGGSVPTPLARRSVPPVTFGHRRFWAPFLSWLLGRTEVTSNRLRKASTELPAPLVAKGTQLTLLGTIYMAELENQRKRDFTNLREHTLRWYWLFPSTGKYHAAKRGHEIVFIWKAFVWENHAFSKQNVSLPG